MTETMDGMRITRRVRVDYRQGEHLNKAQTYFFWVESQPGKPYYVYNYKRRGCVKFPLQEEDHIYTDDDLLRVLEKRGCRPPFYITEYNQFDFEEHHER